MGVAHPTEIGIEPGAAAAVSRLIVVPQRRYGIWIGTAFA
ncbi:MAG: amino acid ABC transporter permease, partial [Mesorhizobium sp.]